MPGGIRLLAQTEAAITTPPADEVTVFANADDGNAPSYKDEAGVVHALEGDPGAPAPALVYLDHGNTGATETVDASAADIHRLVADSATVTLTLSGAPSAGTPCVIRLWLEQDGSGGRDWAFPASVDFGDPGEPDWTTRSGGAVDLVDLMTVDGGTTWIAAIAGREGPSGTIDYGEDADIVDQDYDDVADAGVLDEVARADHRHGMPSAAGASFPQVSVNRVETDQTQSGNSSYDDLATSGPAVTVTVNTKVRVTIGCRSYTAQANQAPYGAMGFALSSGNTLAAAAARSLFFSSGANGGDGAASMSFILTGLTPGSTVFTAKYNQFGAAGTTHYLSREISVELLD